MDANDNVTFKKPDNTIASKCQLVVFSPDIFSDFISSMTAKNTDMKSSSTDDKRTSLIDGHSSLYKTNPSPRKRGRKPANKSKVTAKKKFQNLKQKKQTHSKKSTKNNEAEKNSKEHVKIYEGEINEIPLLKEVLSSNTEYADFSKTTNQESNHKSDLMESSMLQTSTLLKESVLLSPSFVDSITMNVNEYRTNKEVMKCLDFCESQNLIVNSNEDIKSVLIPVFTSENVDENIRNSPEHQLHQTCENTKTDKSVIALSHTTGNSKDEFVIVKISEPDISNTTNSDLHIKSTDLTQVDQNICATPALNIVQVTDNVNEKADNINSYCEKPNFSHTSSIEINNQRLKSKSHNKQEISILSNKIIKPAISNMHLIHINSTKSYVAHPKSCKEIIGEISINGHLDHTVHAEKLKICTNNEKVSREIEQYTKTNTLIDMSITLNERDNNEYLLSSNLSAIEYNNSSPTLNSNHMPKLHVENSLELREMHENNDRACEKNPSEWTFGSKNIEHYENTELILKSLQGKYFLPDLGNSIHLESTSLSSNISSLTDNEAIINSDERFSLQEKTMPIQIKETTICKDKNDIFDVERSKELLKTPTQVNSLIYNTENRKSSDNMNMYFKTDETQNDDPENSSKLLYHGTFKTHDSSHITDCDTVNNETISRGCRTQQAMASPNISGPIGSRGNISNASVFSESKEDSKTYTGEIYFSPQKVLSVSSCSEKPHICREQSNESNIISTLADYLKKAFRRKTDYLRLQYSQTTFTDTSNDKHSRLKCTVNDPKGVEKAGRNINKNGSTRDWKNVITYAHRKSSRMLKTERRHFLSTSRVKLLDDTENSWYENVHIDCDVTSDNQTIDVPIFHFDSKYAFNSDLENIAYRIIDDQSNETICTPGHETKKKNSISSVYKYSENDMESEYDITMSIGVMPVNEGENERLNESETIFSAEENVELFQNILANNSTELLVSTILNEGSLTYEDSHHSENLIELADLKSNESDIIINTLFSSSEYSFDVLEKISEIDLFRDSQCNIGDSTVIAPLNQVEIQKRFVDCTNKFNKEFSVLHAKMSESENNTQINGLEGKSEKFTKQDIDQTPQSYNLKSSQQCNTNATTITKKRRGRPPKLKCLDLDTSENTSSDNIIADSCTSSDTRLQSGNGPSNKGDSKDTDQERDSIIKVNNVNNTVQVKANKKRASKRKSVIEDESNVNSHNIEIKSTVANCTQTQSASIAHPVSAVGHQSESTEEDLQLKDKESDTKQCKRKKTICGQSEINIISLLHLQSTPKVSTNFSNSSSSTINTVHMVQCGICYKQFKMAEWLHHCGKEHNYMAWINGDKPIDFSDNNAVIQHLRKISKPGFPLVCTVCLKTWNSPKRYWDHIRHCTVEPKTEHVQSKIFDSMLHKKQIKTEKNDNVATSTVRCGICDWQGCDNDWWDHMFKEHEYLAWRDREPPIDLNNEKIVQDHLKSILQRLSKLTCRRCGAERKYVKSYMNHSKACLGIELDNSNVARTDDEEQNSLLVEIGSKPASNDIALGILKYESEIEPNENVKCGVCEWRGLECDWLEHIFKEHDYLAWREGEEHLDLNNAEVVHDHLKLIVQKVSKLKCRRCGIKRKYVKLYLNHVKSCEGVDPDASQMTAEEEHGLTVSTIQDGSSWMDDSSAQIRNEENNVDVTSTNVKCAVCQWRGAEGLWFDHIFKQHDYLAWRDGEQPVDLEDEDAVLEHLKPIIHKLSKLVCKRCGIERKLVKSYVKHYKSCTGIPTSVIQVVETSSVNNISSEESGLRVNKRRRISDNDEDNISLMRLKETDKPVTCAVCQQQVDGFKWHDHLIEHNYMAWVEGEPQLDEARQLKAMLLEYKMLTCRLCQAQLSSAGGYQYHIRRCEEKSQRLPRTQLARRYVRKSDVVLPTSQHPTSDPVKCAVCFEEMPNKQWKSHLENVHYNLAWFEGGVPFDIMDHHTCYLILQELLKKKRLVCVQCGLSRISAAGFYAHIIVCKKSEEEIEAMKVQCPVCERKYLSLAISQHMLTHRTQDTMESSPQSSQHADAQDSGGRRRAAVAAKANIEKITSVLVEDKKCCTICNYVAYTSEELQKHATWCGRGCFNAEETGDFDGDEDSGREGTWESESEESDSQVDSNLSAEEFLASGSDVESGHEHKHKEYAEKKKDTSVERTAYKPGLDDKLFNNLFYKEFAKDFCRTHLTTSVLFPELKCNKFDGISGDIAAHYMPPMSRSCKIFKLHSQTDTIQWNQLDVFQCERKYGNHTLFVGGPITGISFIPPADRLSCKSSEHYMSVTCQQDANAAGLACNQLYSHPGLVQIWSFGKFGKETARLVLGIAHDYGTVWGLDWCPSGGWEPEIESDQGGSEPRRIGLMVAACSDGGVYIFAVCDPRQLPQSEKPIYRTRPVMELQLCSEGLGRPRHQATAVQWSVQKDHSVVCVGYADGTIALYNINTSSPLLRTVKDGVIIIYPYHDSKICSSTVTGVQVYPSSTHPEEVSVGVFSVTNGKLMLRAGTGTAPIISRRFHASGIPFLPYWPALHLPVNENIAAGVDTAWMQTAATESRRVCNMPTSTCIFTRRIAVATPTAQLLLLRNLYPQTDCIKRHMLATFELVPLKDKIKVKANGKLGVCKEPSTYGEAVKEYGVLWMPYFKWKVTPPADRYPLSSITAVAFCPCSGHFSRLAWGGLNGIVHLITI